MAKSYLDKDGLLYFWQKIKTYFTGTVIPSMDGTGHTGSSQKFAREDHVHPSDTTKVDKVSGKGLSTNDYTTTEKNKLAGIASGAEVNVQSDWNQTTTTADDYIKNKPTIPTLKNVFGKVKVGSTTIEADTTQDTLELAAGSNVTLTPDATNDKVTIAATDTTYSAGDGITINSGTISALVGNGITINNGAISALVNAANGLSIDTNGKISMGAASTSAAGAMSSSDKTKLNGIATGAEVNQNAFSNVKVGSTTLAAAAKTDTLELVAGSNVTLTADATNDKVTIAATDTTYSSGNFISINSSNVISVSGLTASDVSAIPTSAKGAASGVCPLNASSKIDSTYLPSYVDDVIEAYPRSGQTELSSGWLSLTSGGSALTPETGKIYVLMADSTSYATNTQFRWASGTSSTYIKLADGGVSSITNGEIDTIVAS